MIIKTYENFKHLKYICSVNRPTQYFGGWFASISILTLKSTQTHLFFSFPEFHLKDNKG